MLKQTTESPRHLSTRKLRQGTNLTGGEPGSLKHSLNTKTKEWLLKIL